MPDPAVQLQQLNEKMSKAITDLGSANNRLTVLEAKLANGVLTEDSVADIKQEMATISEANTGTVDSMKALKEEMSTRLNEFEATFGAPDFAGGGQASEKAGHQLVKALADGDETHTKQLQAKTRKEFKTWNFDNRKTITDATGSGEELIVPQYLPGIIDPAERILTIRSLLPVGQTMSSVIIFMRESSVTDNAGPQAVQGAIKPESDFTFTQDQVNVITLAHWVKVSTQMLEDVAQLRSYINTRMRFLLLKVEEDGLLLGDGTPGNLHGLIPQATAFDAQLLADLQVTSATDIDRIRAAILQVQLAHYAPTGLIFNPFNWAALELRKDNDLRYLFAAPQNTTIPRFWGLPVISTTAMPRGQFLTGAFQLGAQIWDKMLAAVAISTEDDDNFQRNLATIRAEERLALTVYRPESFVKGSFAIGSGSGS